jgi:hypothetical protein
MPYFCITITNEWISLYYLCIILLSLKLKLLNVTNCKTYPASAGFFIYRITDTICDHQECGWERAAAINSTINSLIGLGQSKSEGKPSFGNIGDIKDLIFELPKLFSNDRKPK